MVYRKLSFRNTKKKKHTRKRGGERAKDTTLCMYSANMDNGANGQHGFHPVWGNSLCNHDNLSLQSKDVGMIQQYGVHAGKPFTGGKSRKYLLKGGGETLTESLEKLKEALDKMSLPPTEQQNNEERTEVSSPLMEQQLQINEERTEDSSNPMEQPNNEERTEEVSSPPMEQQNNEEITQNVTQGGSGIKKSMNHNKHKRTKKGGGNYYSGVYDNYGSLVQTMGHNQNWIQSYNPLAVSNYPYKIPDLPHNNKYTWNQEG